MYRKNLKAIILGIILSLLLFAWYIDKFVAPVTLKNFFIKNISQAINRPVSLKSAHFSLIRGFILEGLTIYEPDAKTVFIKTERLSTTLLFIPLLQEKRIIIPSVYIYAPSINLIKNQDNTWNFSNPPLFKKEPPLTKSGEKGFSLLVQKIRVNNGEINFLDNSKDPSYAKQLINLSGDVAFSIKNNTINFKTTSQLNAAQKTSIGLAGSYIPNEDAFIIKGLVKNLAILELFNYFSKADFPLKLKDGYADVSFDLNIDSQRKLAVVVNSAIKNLDVSGAGLNLKGDLGISGAFNSRLSEPFQPNYKIDLDLKGPALSGVYLLNELSGLSGKIEITNDVIRTASLEGYAYNTPIKFTGGIDLKKLELRLAAQAAIDLINYKNFIPKGLKEKFNGIDMEGPAEVNIKFFDRLKDPQPLAINGNAKLKAVTLKTAALPDKFENCSGEILFKNDVFYISRASFDYGAQGYIIDAKVSDLSSPDIKMRLKGKEFLLTSRFQILKNKIHVLRLAGKYMNSFLNMAGDIDKLETPNISAGGNLTLDLLDLRKVFPSVAETLTRFGVKGICNLDVSLNGPWKDPAAFEAVIKGESSNMGFWNFKLEDTKFNLTMKNKHLVVSELSEKSYGGTMLFNMDIDLAQQNPPYAINLAMEEIDLSKLVLDTDFKDKPVSGRALCKCSIRGYGKNTETIKGEGLVFIKGGYLWEMPFLRGIADLLFMPNLSSIIFDEVSANFAVANKAISTSNLKCHSQNVGLLAEGNIYFDGALDFIVTTSISQNFIKGSSEFERLASSLLAEAGQLIGRVKIGGTIKKPEYKFVPFPIDQILKDKLKGLLGGFF